MSDELITRLEKMLDNDEARLHYPMILANNKQRVYVHKVYEKMLPLAKEVYRLTPNERTAFNEILAALENSQEKK